MVEQKKCAGEDYGFSPIECDNPATTSVQVEDEYRAPLCAECYDAADAIRIEAWEYYYRTRR